MPTLDLKPKAVKFINRLPPKHQLQLKNAILELGEDPLPHDSKRLRGHERYIRKDVGEYRVIYRYDEPEDIVTVVLAGKRNDGEIYRIAKRVL